MFRGDLSNVVVPRILVVFEGAIGHLREEDLKKFYKYQSKRRFAEALECFDVSELMLASILRVCMRDNLNVSLVTWMQQGMAEAIAELMNYYSVPVRGCVSESPYLLSAKLPYNPDIIAVYDPDPEHVLIFGSKGVLLDSPGRIGR